MIERATPSSVRRTLRVTAGGAAVRAHAGRLAAGSVAFERLAWAPTSVALVPRFAALTDSAVDLSLLAATLELVDEGSAAVHERTGGDRSARSASAGRMPRSRSDRRAPVGQLIEGSASRAVTASRGPMRAALGNGALAARSVAPMAGTDGSNLGAPAVTSPVAGRRIVSTPRGARDPIPYPGGLVSAARIAELAAGGSAVDRDQPTTPTPGPAPLSADVVARPERSLRAGGSTIGPQTQPDGEAAGTRARADDRLDAPRGGAPREPGAGRSNADRSDLGTLAKLAAGWSSSSAHESDGLRPFVGSGQTATTVSLSSSAARDARGIDADELAEAVAELLAREAEAHGLDGRLT